MKVAYVTAGNTGAGHLTRGVAVERGLRRTGWTGGYAMIGPKLPYPAASRADYRVVEIEQGELEDPSRAPESALARELEGFRPDVVLVDMFWAPLRYILPLRGAAAWMLLRACPKPWLVGPSKAPFDRSQYERIIGIEPYDEPVVPERIDPIVVANSDERRPRGALRELLGVPRGEPVVVIVHAGKAGEVDILRSKVAEGVRADVFDLHEPRSPFPLAEWLGGADAILCASGYNTYWEARWLGHDRHTTFHPFPRGVVDDQARRVRVNGSFRFSENGADTLARLLRAG